MAFLPLVTPYSTSPSEMKADLIARAPMRCAGEQGVDGNVHLNDLSDTLSDFRFECPARFRHGLIDQGLERVGWHVGTLAAHLFNRLVKNAATHGVFDEFREITFFSYRAWRESSEPQCQFLWRQIRSIALYRRACLSPR